MGSLVVGSNSSDSRRGNFKMSHLLRLFERWLFAAEMPFKAFLSQDRFIVENYRSLIMAQPVGFALVLLGRWGTTASHYLIFS